jgi:hypothetical protein
MVDGHTPLPLWLNENVSFMLQRPQNIILLAKSNNSLALCCLFQAPLFSVIFWIVWIIVVA